MWSLGDGCTLLFYNGPRDFRNGLATSAKSGLLVFVHDSIAYTGELSFSVI